MFENRVLSRLFGPKRDEVTREWRKLHNEELNDLYCSPDFFFSPGATTPIVVCIFQPSSGL